MNFSKAPFNIRLMHFDCRYQQIPVCRTRRLDAVSQDLNLIIRHLKHQHKNPNSGFLTMAAPTLAQYVCDRFPHIGETKLLASTEFDAHASAFTAFLHDTRVVCGGKNGDVAPNGSAFKVNGSLHEESYPKFITAICKHIFPEPSNAFAGPDSGLTRFSTGFLKDTMWEKLCVIIGRQSFADMLGDVTFLLRPSGNVTLSRNPSPYARKGPPREYLRKFHMYFGRTPRHKVSHVLPEDADRLVRSIFKCSGQQRHFPKRYRQLYNLLTVAVRNDAKLPYHYIVENIMHPQEQELQEGIFANAVPFSQVTRFVFVVIHRVFPRDIFGSQDNWNIVNDSIYEILKSDRSETIDARAIVQRLEVTEIPWLGKSKRPTSKQDFVSRTSTLYDFIVWFLSRFAVRLVSLFWYVTDNPVRKKPCEPSNAYFLHGTWSKLSRPWLQEYMQKYLRQEGDTQDGSRELVPYVASPDSLFNTGALRLVPKKLDFRPLCIPIKVYEAAVASGFTAAAQKKQHAFYDFNVIRPIRDILRNQQKKQANMSTPFPRCNSVSDVAQGVAKFKGAILSKYGSVPALFGVQFDMKHCYDNLNQAKILRCIEDLFQNDSSSEEYIVRKYGHAPSLTSKHMIQRNLIKTSKNIEELDVFQHIPEGRKSTHFFGDKLKTSKFRRGDVLDLIRSQVLDATTEVPTRNSPLFKRTRGVFQGFPLSGTLCDISYDSLVDNILARVRDVSYECLLLRLADDFLFISTSKTACERMLELARSRDAKEYGAHVNHEKISWIDSSERGEDRADFLGLSIDLQTLNVERPENSVMLLPQRTRRSLKATLEYLDWRFRLRIADYLFDLKLSEFKTVTKTACEVYAATLKVAIQSARSRSDQDVEDQLRLFTLDIYLATIQKFQTVNGRPELTQELATEIWLIIESQFSQHGFSSQELSCLLQVCPA